MSSYVCCSHRVCCSQRVCCPKSRQCFLFQMCCMSDAFCSAECVAVLVLTEFSEVLFLCKICRTGCIDQQARCVFFVPNVFHFWYWPKIRCVSLYQVCYSAFTDGISVFASFCQMCPIVCTDRKAGWSLPSPPVSSSRCTCSCRNPCPSDRG